MGKMIACAIVVALVWAVGPAFAAPIVPSLRGIYDPGDGGPRKALWGYENQNANSFLIPLGSGNYFLPAPNFRGQTTQFSPGAVYASFITNFDGNDQTWWLEASNGSGPLSATASATSPSLPFDPEALIGPGGLVPFVSRVWEAAPNQYMAEFGYASAYDSVVALPAGAGNYLSPSAPVAGQPSLFQPGLIESAFTVPFTGESLTWHLSYGGATRTATAYASAIPEPGALAIIAMAATSLLPRHRRLRAV